MDGLIKKLGIGIVLVAVSLGAFGCLKPTSYEDKARFLEAETKYSDLKQNDGITVPLAKYEFD